MNIYRLILKEIISIKRSLKVVLFITLLPMVTIYFTASQDFSTSFFSKELSVVLLLFLPSYLSTILVCDSLTKERKEGTLEVLLTSSIDYSKIIFSKAILIPLIGLVIQCLQLVFIKSAEIHFNIMILPIYYKSVLILMPFLTYALSIIAIISSTKLKFEKLGEQALMIFIAILGFGFLKIMLDLNIYSQTYQVLILIFAMTLLNIGLTKWGAKLTKYVTYYDN